MRIAIDAIGGDYAPDEIVQGVVESASSLGETQHILVGPLEEIQFRLSKLGKALGNIYVEHASEGINMAERPMEALRRKKDSSIARCIELLKSGRADAMVSAGNTGAVVAASVLGLGLLFGVKRAGIAAPIPTDTGVCILIDVGANLNCKPHNLFHYGVMASLYSKYIFGSKQSPKIGLLNIGHESIKGDNTYAQAYELFERSSLNFVGNVEGHEIFSGRCDVVVCDGFVGNIALKTGEGAISYLIRQFIRWQGSMNGSFTRFQQRLDYSEYGGAPLLGVKGVVIICHGRSRAKAIANAIRVAANFVDHRINEHIVDELKRFTWWGRLQEWWHERSSI
jgi:glycerol-3-phosphate acyltransferase PlsX